jgi:hypothetical protein
MGKPLETFRLVQYGVNGGGGGMFRLRQKALDVGLVNKKVLGHDSSLGRSELLLILKDVIFTTGKKRSPVMTVLILYRTGKNRKVNYGTPVQGTGVYFQAARNYQNFEEI